MIVTSLITLLTARCANCLAAVVLTEVLDPVSSNVSNLSNLMNNEMRNVKAARFNLPRSHAAIGSRAGENRTPLFGFIYGGICGEECSL